MKPKTGFQLVQAVLFMMAMLCVGVMLLPGDDIYKRTDCLSQETPASDTCRDAALATSLFIPR